MILRFLPLIFIAIAACSSEHGQQGAIPPEQIEVLDRESAKITVDSAEISCENGACSEAVGAFYMYHGPQKNGSGKSHQIRLCSLTLIASNKVLTNKHCIEDVINAGESFSEDVFAKIKFPKVGNIGFSSYAGKKVLSTSDDYYLIDKDQKKKRKRQAPDWAIIELTEHVRDRTPVAVSTTPTPAAVSFVTMYPVYFDLKSKNLKGVLKKVSCTRVINNGDVHIFSSEFGPLISVESCSHELISGNSGSGIFSSITGELLGVIATAMGRRGGGTVTHCVDDLSSTQVPCIFPADTEFIDAMKTTSFLKRVQKSVNDNPQSGLLEDAEGISYFEKTESGAHDKVTSTLREFWALPAHYLSAKGSESLAHRYRRAFQQVVLPRVPKCFTKPLATPVYLNVIDLESWKSVLEYQWAETIESDKSGKDISYVRELLVPSVRYVSRRVRFDVTTEKNQTVLTAKEGASELPEPMTSLQIRVSACP